MNKLTLLTISLLFGSTHLVMASINFSVNLDTSEAKCVEGHQSLQQNLNDLKYEEEGAALESLKFKSTFLKDYPDCTVMELQQINLFSVYAGHGAFDPLPDSIDSGTIQRLAIEKCLLIEHLMGSDGSDIVEDEKCLQPLTTYIEGGGSLNLQFIEFVDLDDESLGGKFVINAENNSGSYQINKSTVDAAFQSGEIDLVTAVFACTTLKYNQYSTGLDSWQVFDKCMKQASSLAQQKQSIGGVDHAFIDIDGSEITVHKVNSLSINGSPVIEESASDDGSR